jgi:acyl dehydratase
MDARYFEDWKVGDRIETMGRTVGDAEISQFVALGGFFEELFMSDEYVAHKSLYPKRFAPGALIFAFAEGLIILSGCIHGGTRVGRRRRDDLQAPAVRRRHPCA